MLDQLSRDLRFAARSLRRAPGFSLAVIITYALCIGPNAAIFAVLNQLVLNPLPFHDPGQLVQVNTETRDGANRYSSLLQYLDFKAHADLFSGFGLMSMENSTLGDVSPMRVYGERVTADFFTLLGVKPVLGRFTTPDEEIVGRDHVLVLQDSFWKRQYNSDPTVIGRTIRLAGTPYVVIGIAPASLDQIGTNYWKPYERTPNELDPRRRNSWSATLWARLKPGVVADAGQTQLQTIERRYLADQLSPQMRAYEEHWGYHIALHQPLAKGPQVATALFLLQCGAACVFLVGCVNVANLLLARANAKRSEYSIRFALGAGRGLILRQLLIETLVLTGTGAALGGVLALASLQLINRYRGAIATFTPLVTMGPAVLGLLLLSSLIAGLALGLLPFGMLWRDGLHLNATRTSSSARGLRFLSGVFVVAQVAVALVLLVGAGLMLGSLNHVLAVQPGFDIAETVEGRVAMPGSYNPPANILAQQRILAAMRAIPGVKAASMSNSFPIDDKIEATPYLVRGATSGQTPAQSQVFYQQVASNFFGALGIPVLQGRDFLDTDFGATSIQTVVVDQKFAQQNFANGDAVGHDLVFGDRAPTDPKAWLHIVGVVGRANLAGLEQRDGPPFVYLPIVQRPLGGFNLVLRTRRPLPDILGAMRDALRQIDPTLPLYSTNSLQALVDNLLTRRRGILLFVGLFADLALLLAGVGLYGVLAYDVSQRTREIGIRGALGAGRAQIISLILRQGLTRVAVGLAAGLLGAIYFTRFIRGVLFDVAPGDPWVYLGVSLLLLAVGSLASYIPARRATKVDPIVALRCE